MLMFQLIFILLLLSTRESFSVGHVFVSHDRVLAPSRTSRTSCESSPELLRGGSEFVVVGIANCGRIHVNAANLCKSKARIIKYSETQELLRACHFGKRND
jgi:hypothetical protein